MSPFLTRIGVLALACVFYLSGAVALQAASFSELTLQRSGSVDPLGDVITLKYVTSPSDRMLRLEVRAVVLTPKQPVEDNGRVNGAGVAFAATPIQSNDPRYRDDKGNFLAQQSLAAGKEVSVASVSITIPFKALSLQPGAYRTSYIVRLVTQGDSDSKEVVAFDSATELGELVVTANERQLTMTETKRVLVPRSVESEVRVPDARIREGFRRERMAVEIDDYQLRSESRSAMSRWESKVRDLTVAAAPVDVSPRDGLIGDLKRSIWTPTPDQRVYFATNRGVAIADSKSVDRFGNAVDPQVRYGSVIVNIPTTVHRRGEANEQNWWQKWWSAPDPEKHVFARDVAELASSEFDDAMKALLGNSKDDVLVVIHGYANTFESVLLTAGRLKYDIEFAGPVVAFSWPSEGRPVSLLSPAEPYRNDEGKATKSVDALVEVLTRLTKAQEGAATGRVHILAHSMGSRILVSALDKMGATVKPGARKPFGHVIFAAPDVPVKDFTEAMESMNRAANDLTLYFCSDDIALAVSRKINDDSRVGQNNLLIPPLQNIDCTKANTSWLGHGYAMGTSVILTDLQMYVQQSKGPDDRRPPLRSMGVPPKNWWAFP